jgi:hypothetical protein
MNKGGAFMIGPYRLRRSAPVSTSEGAKIAAESVEGTPATRTATAPQGVGALVQSYLDRLMKMVPAEVIGLYLVGHGVIPAGQTTVFIIWTVICLIAVVAVRIYGTIDPTAQHRIDWLHVVISTIAFLIWIYTIGGPDNPFASFYQSYIGSLLVLVWTFFVPIFYQGAD